MSARVLRMDKNPALKRVVKETRRGPAGRNRQSEISLTKENIQSPERSRQKEVLYETASLSSVSAPGFRTLMCCMEEKRFSAFLLTLEHLVTNGTKEEA